MFVNNSPKVVTCKRKERESNREPDNVNISTTGHTIPNSESIHGVTVT